MKAKVIVKDVGRSIPSVVLNRPHAGTTLNAKRNLQRLLHSRSAGSVQEGAAPDLGETLRLRKRLA